MKMRNFLWGFFLVSIMVATFSCQKKENAKEIHFGPGPGDGEAKKDENAREESFGPSPGDGCVEEAFHFGPEPGDG